MRSALLEAGHQVVGAESLPGCDAAIYLLARAGGGEGRRQRAVTAAEAFAAEASRARIARIVYLGALPPAGPASDEVASRLEVGQVLRSGIVPTVELRAGIIVGAGSPAWRILQELAAGMPVVLPPPWLEARTQPVALRDVVVALSRALDVEAPRSLRFDLPGPETLSARTMLEMTARLIRQRPRLRAWLSAQWRVLRIARELGLDGDLLSDEHDYWELIGHAERLGFERAAREALSEEEPAR